MFRVVVTYLLPLFGPLLLYLAWNAYAKSRAKKAGEDIPSIEKGPVFWSLVIGFTFLIISLFTLAMTTGVEPGEGRYVAPYMKDGKVMPPRFE